MESLNDELFPELFPAAKALRRGLDDAFATALSHPKTLLSSLLLETDDFPPFILVGRRKSTRAISFRLVSTDRLYLCDLPPVEWSLSLLYCPSSLPQVKRLPSSLLHTKV